MTGHVSEWLPDDALVAPSFLASIDARVAAWSTRWFGDRALGRYDKPGSPAKLAMGQIARHGWHRFGPGIWIDWGEQTAQTVALHAVDRADLHPKLSEDDEQLLALLGEKIAGDLAAGLARPSAPISADTRDSPDQGLAFKLCSTSQAVNLSISLDRTLLAELRKQQFPPWRPPVTEYRPLAAALAEVPVAFEVALGSVRMSLLEFEGIEPGDTIVLERRISDPIALQGTETGTTIGTAKLVREDGRLLLTAS